jgi:hypothetical protein
MNKLYLLSALVAAAYAQADACDYATDTASSGDYAFDWTISSLATTTACYNEYIYDFQVYSAYESSDDTTDQSASVYAAGFAASGKKAKNVAFVDSTTFTAAYVTSVFTNDVTDPINDDSENMDSDYNGGTISSEYGITTMSNGDKSANAAGWTVVFYNSGSDTVDIVGGTNNAVFAAASTLTFGAVAGLFF